MNLSLIFNALYMDQDPFYSDYDDNEIDWNWRCDDCNVSMNPNNPFVAEISIPIGETDFVQKYGNYVSADVKYPLHSTS